MKYAKQQGATFIEIVVLMGVFAILFSFTSINLFGANQKTSTTAMINTLVADLRQQQIRAMAGEANAQAVPYSFGVRFEQDKYILFSGDTYISSNDSNFSIPIDEDITFSSISLPLQQIVFATGSGEIVRYSDTLHSVTITNTASNTQKVIYFNRYGVITQIQ